MRWVLIALTHWAGLTSRMVIPSSLPSARR